MISQLAIIFTLFVIGFLFISLFYPKIPFSLIISSALFWGGLINTIVGILLGFFGWYSGWIWVVFALIVIVLIFLHIRTKKRWANAPWRKIILIFVLMVALFLMGYFVFDQENQLVTTSASLPFIIVGSRIFNYGTIFLPGAGYDFRSHYGISEALVHALGGFIDAPALSLWHPFLWISLYSFIFAAIYEFSKHAGIKRLFGIAVGIGAVLWTATTPMNWFQSYFIHVHLFSSFSLIIFVYLFWQMVNSKNEEFELAFLSSFALFGYALSRVESPMMILGILGLSLITHHFHLKEYRIFFYPQILLEIVWLGFLYFAYKGTTTQYWSDNRILAAVGVYFSLLVALILNESYRFDLKLGWIKPHVTKILLAVPIFMFALDYQRAFQVIKSVFENMFGSLHSIGYGSWDLFWIEAVIISVFLLACFRPWTKAVQNKQNLDIFINVIIAYLVLILILGFFRTEPYTGIRWGDSASRMLSHIAPLLGLFIGLAVTDIFRLIEKDQEK